MKCTACGNEEFIKISIIKNNVVATSGYVSQNVISYACSKCGHVELYIPQELLNEYKHSVQLEKEKEKKIQDVNATISKVTNKISKLKNILDDENQTVKTIKETKIELSETENLLKSLKIELSRITKENNGIND